MRDALVRPREVKMLFPVRDRPKFWEIHIKIMHKLEFTRGLPGPR